jgi:hypothetical protein
MCDPCALCAAVLHSDDAVEVVCLWRQHAQRRVLCLQIFGATEDDVAALQIVSLQEVDLDTMNAMFDDAQ